MRLNVRVLLSSLNNHFSIIKYQHIKQAIRHNTKNYIFRTLNNTIYNSKIVLRISRITKYNKKESICKINKEFFFIFNELDT